MAWLGVMRASIEKNLKNENQQSLMLCANNLQGFRIFIAETGDMRREARVLERFEAAIMGNLYQQASPICDIPDKGMYLAPRRKSENPIIVRNNCEALLHGLPAFLKI
jgi:hypothetical protein